MKPSFERVETLIYRDLREQIVRLVRQPGERLFLEELSSHYGASLTPIRQALARLETEGLVVTIPRRGSQVAPLTFDQLEEIFSIRIGVEPALARFGAEMCDPSIVAAMENDLRRSSQALSSEDFAACFEARAQCRDLCYQAANRPRLLRIVQVQRQRAERFVLLMAEAVETLAGTLRFHQSLIDACGKHDGRLAFVSTFRALTEAFDQIGSILDENRSLDWQWIREFPL